MIFPFPYWGEGKEKSSRTEEITTNKKILKVR